MQRLGNCASCAASSTILPFGSYSTPAGLGNCASCMASSTILPLGSYPASGFGDWYSELKTHLKPMAPWIAGAAIISGIIGFKAGKWYCSGLFLEREARVAAGLPARKRKRKNKHK